MMTDRLKEAFSLAEQFPEDEQQAFAEMLLEEMRATERWDALFADPRSDKVLERLVNEALAEDEAGETEEITGDGFL